MSSKDNCPPSASPPAGDDLLQKIMPQLGLEATGPTDRYRNEARTKYLVPRIIILCVVAALIAATAFVLMLPARFQDVSLEEAPDKATVNFRMDRVMLLESVTATLDGHPISVPMLDAGSYELELDRNGELNVEARTFTGRRTSVSMTIDCIDDQSPRADHDVLVGKYLYIFLTDGEGKASSGINWDTLKVTTVDSGELYEGVLANPAAGYVHIPMPDESVRIYVEDNSGNPLSLRLDRPQSE